MARAVGSQCGTEWRRVDEVVCGYSSDGDDGEDDAGDRHGLDQPRLASAEQRYLQRVWDGEIVHVSENAEHGGASRQVRTRILVL